MAKTTNPAQGCAGNLLNSFYRLVIVLKKFSSILLLTLPLLAFAAEINKWTDANGKVHYGQIPPAYAKVTIMDVKSRAPRISEGEHEMRRANDYYFENLYQKREVVIKERKKQIQMEKKRIASLEREKAAIEKAKKTRCGYHEKKIADYERKLRQGYSSSQGARYHQKKYQHEAEYRQKCR